MFHDLKLQLAVQACSSHPFLWPCVLFMEPDWNNSSAEMCWSACGLHQPKPELNTDAEMWQGYLLLVSEPLVEDKILCQSLIWTRQRDGEKKKAFILLVLYNPAPVLKALFQCFSVVSPIAYNDLWYLWWTDAPSYSLVLGGGLTAGRAMVEPFDDVPQSCRLSVYAWWHRVTPVPQLCLVLKSLKADIHREVTSHVVHQSLSQVDTFALKTRGFFSLVASGLLKGTSVCSSNSPETSQ